MPSLVCCCVLCRGTCSAYHCVHATILTSWLRETLAFQHSRIFYRHFAGALTRATLPSAVWFAEVLAAPCILLSGVPGARTSRTLCRGYLPRALLGCWTHGSRQLLQGICALPVRHLQRGRLLRHAHLRAPLFIRAKGKTTTDGTRYGSAAVDCSSALDAGLCF